MANCLIILLLPCPGSKNWVQSAVLLLTIWVALEIKAALMGLGFIIQIVIVIIIVFMFSKISLIIKFCDIRRLAIE